MKTSQRYRKIELVKIGADSLKPLDEDLFVFLPSLERYVRFVQKGELLTDSRLEALARHSDPALYALIDGASEPVVATELRELAGQLEVDTLSTEDLELLSAEVEAELKDIYTSLVVSDASHRGDILRRLEELSTRVLELVAPEINQVRAKLIANVRYLPLMHASAAIATLGVLCANANGVSSRKSMRDLSLASFFMDLSLCEFTPAVRDAFLLAPETLSAEMIAEIQQHPLRSYNLALDNLPSLPEQVRQLILNHHELFNGRGYPRGIRSEVLFPMARFLALAVDIYEHLFCAQTRGQSEGVAEVLYALLERDVEPHLRRHGRAMVLSLFAYLELPLSKP